MFGGGSSNASSIANKRLGVVLVGVIALLATALFVDKIKESITGHQTRKSHFVHGFRSWYLKQGRDMIPLNVEWGSREDLFQGDFPHSMKSRGIAWMIFAVFGGIITGIAILIGCIMENYRCSQKALAKMLLMASVSLSLACMVWLNIEYPDVKGAKIESKIEWGSSWIMVWVDAGILAFCSLVLYVRDLEAWD